MDKRVLLAASFACISNCAFAQDNPLRPQKGAKEVGLAGSLFFSAGNSSTSVSGSLGYYFTSSIVGQIALSTERASGSASEPICFLGVRYEFNTPGQFAPYLVGGLIGSNSAGKSDFTFKTGAGANYYFRPTSALFAEVAFFRFRESKNTTTVVDLGFRFFFK